MVFVRLHIEQNRLIQTHPFIGKVQSIIFDEVSAYSILEANGRTGFDSLRVINSGGEIKSIVFNCKILETEFKKKMKERGLIDKDIKKTTILPNIF